MPYKVIMTIKGNTRVGKFCKTNKAEFVVETAGRFLEEEIVLLLKNANPCLVKKDRGSLI